MHIYVNAYSTLELATGYLTKIYAIQISSAVKVIPILLFHIRNAAYSYFFTNHCSSRTDCFHVFFGYQQYVIFQITFLRETVGTAPKFGYAT